MTLIWTLAKVNDIAFYSTGGFHGYPKGILDLLRLSLLPFKSRVKLLRILFPLAFTSLEKTELWDDVPLTDITKNLDSDTNAFFESVCMLAFADTADHISLGEFTRTMIRANPFKGEQVNSHILIMVVMIQYLMFCLIIFY